MANDTERQPTERAKRLGCRLRRRGNVYRLFNHAEGTETVFLDVEDVHQWLDMIESDLRSRKPMAR
jgi:hypothetical protein